MRVCVFGGTGFIGSRVVKCLVGNGHQVVTLARSPEKGAALGRLGVRVTYGDLTSRDDIRQALAGADVVVNVSVPDYRGRVSLSRVRNIGRQHLAYITAILDEARRAGNFPVIVSEGTLLWGDSGDGWHDETAALRPLGMGRVGVWSSPHIQKMIEEHNAPIVRIFPGMVYGAGSWFENSVYSLLKKGWFRTFGDGQNVVSVVHVDDLAEAYRLAVEQLPVGQAIAVVDDEPVRFRDFANGVARVLGKPPVKSMPVWLGSLMAGQAMAETLTMSCRAKNAKAQALLGWQPKHSSYEQGIREAVAEIERGHTRV